MKTRMQPIGVVWNKLPRLVRDLATSSGKQIQLEMDGADTELDKTIIEAIKDPLTHIVRNCCDHGIEKPEARLRAGKPAGGTLSLRAFHEGGQVNIEISDDGGGVNLQRVKEKALEKGLVRPDQIERMSEREVLGLIFLPGFSTAPKVTSVSGRGVGMDVVKTNIEKIGGAADLASRVGEGTTVKLKIPLTLAIIPGLVVKNGGERFVIPQVSLLELIRLETDSGKSSIEWIHGTPVYRHRDRLLPITYLSQVLGQGATQNSDAINIVVLQAEDRQFGLVVDDIQDTQEIVVKPLGKQLKGLSCYAGATIMGDGRVALILDVLGIGQLSGVVQESREQTKADTKHKDRSDRDHQTFLLFRAGRFERLSVPLALVARLEEFPKSKIEHAGGKRVVQYRGKILSLVSLTSILQGEEAAEIPDPVQVVVFGNGERSIGIMVDQILDIVQESVEVRQPARSQGMLGSAVIGGKVTDILDLQAIIEAADNHWFGKPEVQASEKPTVMLAEASSFTRGIVRSSLEMAGYRVDLDSSKG
jgi:two-component system chemotaxis sensor kinase CheA